MAIQMTAKVDEYRVNLFKNKLRAMLPDMEGLRFGYSRGRCHLILDIGWRYKHPEEISRYIMPRLRANGIQVELVRDQFGLYEDRPEIEKPISFIRIPIDQAALPERKRGLVG